MALEVEKISKIWEGHYGLYIFLWRMQEFVLCELLIGGGINDGAISETYEYDSLQ